jgi:hypothetical protein
MAQPTEKRPIQTAVVCYTQAAFDNLVPSGEEIEFEDPEHPLNHARTVAEVANRLAVALKTVNIETDIVKVPQRSFAPRDIAKAAFGWRLLDLKESNGRAIDLVICLDFPAWSLTHPNKTSWLTNLPFFVTRRSSAAPPPAKGGNGVNFADNDTATINSLLQAERRGLFESRRILAGSRAVAEGLARSGVQIEFNPIPAPDVPFDNPAWQSALQRLLR